VDNDPAFDVARSVLIVKGDTTCSSFKDSSGISQVGCRIPNGYGTCTAIDPTTHEVLFTAQSKLLSNGSVQWSLDGKFKADVVLVAGASHGSACSYLYADEAVAGKGLGFLKSTGKYANVNYVEVCTDRSNVPEPVTLKPLPECPQDVQDALDDGSIEGDFAIVGQIGDADTATLCIKDDAAITVHECINEEGLSSESSSSDLPLCSEGPDMNEDGHPDGPQPFKRVMTFDLNKVGDGSCVYTCVPPPLTLGGRSQCGYICK
jgi:hypothetical protein